MIRTKRCIPEFAELRGAMYEETVRFFEDMFRNDGSILDLLNADHAFVNAALAQHYGIGGVEGDEWRRVEGLQAQGRGGILGMATFLASQSGASRTSPILRGNWIYETLLGERLPRPPANVPQLPETVPDRADGPSIDRAAQFRSRVCRTVMSVSIRSDLRWNNTMPSAACVRTEVDTQTKTVLDGPADGRHRRTAELSAHQIVATTWSGNSAASCWAMPWDGKYSLSDEPLLDGDAAKN